MKNILATIGFTAVFLSLGAFVGAQFTNQPPMPPHVSAITPPPIPFEQPFLHHFPRNAEWLHVPEGKTTDGRLLSVANMQMEELLDRVRTNKANLYLIELRDDQPKLKTAIISEEDELVLSNHHRATPQHP